MGVLCIYIYKSAVNNAKHFRYSPKQKTLPATTKLELVYQCFYPCKLSIWLGTLLMKPNAHLHRNCALELTSFLSALNFPHSGCSPRTNCTEPCRVFLGEQSWDLPNKPGKFFPLATKSQMMELYYSMYKSEKTHWPRDDEGYFDAS